LSTRLKNTNLFLKSKSGKLLSLTDMLNRLFNYRFLLSCFIACTGLVNPAISKEAAEVSDLRYGVALYNYYQNNYFDALSELQVAEQRGGIQGHSTDPQVITGGIQLSFGMTNTASELFASLIESGEVVDTKSIAWYYMARLFYQRADFEASREHLSRIITTELTDKLKADAAALDIQLLFRENEYELAGERLLAAQNNRDIADDFELWRPYLAYNLGAHYVRQKNKVAAQPLFDGITEPKLSDSAKIRQEQLAMADRANTASGYSAFQEEKYQEALSYFGQVRQVSAFSDDALLGYGWSAARLEKYTLAIATWQLLSQRELASEAVQESLLAAPYAYLQLNLANEAIAGYQNAEKTFENELLEIDRIGNVILEQPLVDLLSLDNNSVSYNWLDQADNYLVQPYVRSLIELFSYNRFQNSVQNIRDLDQIKHRLNDWKISMAAYDDLLDYRLTQFRAAGSNSNPVVGESDPFKTQALNELTTLRDELADRISQAKDQRDVYIVLDEPQADQLSLIESAEQNIAVLERAGEDVSEEKQWVQRYRGALLWSANKDFDARLWDLTAELNTINEVLDSAANSSTAVESLLTEAPDINSAKVQVQQGNVRIDEVLATTQSLLDSSEAQLRQQIFLVLAEQRQQLQFYLSEARLAIAQIYDNLYLEQQGNDES